MFSACLWLLLQTFIGQYFCWKTIIKMMSALSSKVSQAGSGCWFASPLPPFNFASHLWHLLSLCLQLLTPGSHSLLAWMELNLWITSWSQYQYQFYNGMFWQFFVVVLLAAYEIENLIYYEPESMNENIDFSCTAWHQKRNSDLRLGYSEPSYSIQTAFD